MEPSGVTRMRIPFTFNHMQNKPTLTILTGDCLASLKTLPDNSVQCCVTSPPYYGLRSYLKEGDEGKVSEIGLEETPQQYVEKMVEVFREVRRVLREDGIFWLNLGDSFGGTSGVHAGGSDKANSNTGAVNATLPNKGGKAKNLLGIPWRTAFALQDDGWILRQACYWMKKNSMPESVKDRPSTVIETIFMLTKSPRYFYDAEAVKVSAKTSMKPRDKSAEGWHDGAGTTNCAEGERVWGDNKMRSRRSSDWFFESWQGMLQDEDGDPLAFVVNTKPYKGAHFACFPPELIRPMVRAGCPISGTVLDPFGGSGTTAQVALEHGCNAIVCELNADYIPLIHQRCDPILNKPIEPSLS